MSFLYRILLPSVLIGLLVVLGIHVRPFDYGKSAHLEVKMTSDQAGRARLFWDDGGGFTEHGRIGQPITAGTATYWFPLPEGTFRALRLWPLDRPAQITLHEVRVRDLRGEIVHTFQASSLAAPEGATGAAVTDGAITFAAKPGEGLDFRPANPIKLHRTFPSIDQRAAGVDFAVALACSMSVLLLLQLIPASVRASCATPLWAFGRGAQRIPQITLILFAAISVVGSCIPVVFFGKSFVSPGNGALLLYDDVPTVPGASVTLPENPKASDMGALQWAHLPYSTIQHRAVFQDRELPLWNRYTYAGTPLLGQGLSMIGDPLHWIPIYANGAAWAWDLKFLLAKFLFALGVGLCVRAATGSLGVAVLLTVSSGFLGFFSYRFAHPAFFALCYAPWILLPWLRAASTPGRLWPWALLLAFANLVQLNSGVVKESVAFLFGLNGTGLLLVLLAQEHRWRRVVAMTWGLGIFVLVSAPIWMVFLDSLRAAWTPYTIAKAYQIQPSLLIGLFDDLFYRQFVPWENHFNPSANFLILLGCIWAAVNFRTLLRRPAFVALSLGAVPPALLVFGVIPPALIAKVPFLGNVQHIDNTFSALLIIQLIILAAYGLHVLWEHAPTTRMATDSAVAVGLMAMLLALYLGFSQAGHREGLSVWTEGNTARFSPFFVNYAGAICVAVLAFPWIIRTLRHKAGIAPLFCAGTLLFILHFRHAMWLGTPYDAYVLNPRERVDLAASSPSLDRVKTAIAERGEPARVAGYRDTLLPGHNALHGLEHFAGADALVNPFQRELAESTGLTPEWGWRWKLNGEGNHERIQRLCDLWNVRYLLAMPCDPSPATAPMLDDLAVTENATAWPRAFFADKLISTNALSSFLALLDTSAGKPFAAVTSTDIPGVEAPLSEVQTSPAKNYRLTSNSTSFEITASGPGVAVLTEGYEAGNWRATLNDSPVSYFRVNHAFLGVQIPAAGNHTLRFEYWPASLSRALWLGAGGLFLVLLTPLLAYWFRARPQES